MKFFVHIPCGCGSVLLWWHCATLCTSGFMNDVTFGRNGCDAERWRLYCASTAINDVVIPGQSLMSVNACIELLLNYCHVILMKNMWTLSSCCLESIKVQSLIQEPQAHRLAWAVPVYSQQLHCMAHLALRTSLMTSDLSC